jgi:hypothetical protein
MFQLLCLTTTRYDPVLVRVCDTADTVPATATCPSQLRHPESQRTSWHCEWRFARRSSAGGKTKEENQQGDEGRYMTILYIFSQHLSTNIELVSSLFRLIPEFCCIGDTVSDIHILCWLIPPSISVQIPILCF